MTDFFDALETRDPGVREAALLAALTAQIANAQAHAPAYAERLEVMAAYWATPANVWLDATKPPMSPAH